MGHFWNPKTGLFSEFDSLFYSSLWERGGRGHFSFDVGRSYLKNPVPWFFVNKLAGFLLFFYLKSPLKKVGIAACFPG